MLRGQRLAQTASLADLDKGPESRGCRYLEAADDWHGPKLMAELVAEFTAKGHLTCEEILASAFHLANKHKKIIILSEVSDHFSIDARLPVC